jgi:hypothetical protein
MAKTRKRKSEQTELTLQTPALPPPNERPDAGYFLPVYYPPSGEELGALALRLAPVLAKTGWVVRVGEGEQGDKFLELQNKNGRRRRLSPEEAQAWQALLPQLSLTENLFSEIPPGDRKDA